MYCDRLLTFVIHLRSRVYLANGKVGNKSITSFQAGIRQVRYTPTLEIVRVPLQKFEQSLDDRQRARLSALVASEDVTPVCVKNPEPANWPMPILKQALQPTAAQEGALNNLERAFNRAASGLNAVCSDGMPRMPSARLQAIEARLDITWVAVQTIQVAVAQFQKQLSDQQRARFNALQLAATPYRSPRSF